MSKVFEGGGFKKMLEKGFTSTDQIKEEYGLKGKYADYNAQLLLDYINSQPKSEKTEKTEKNDVKSDSGKKEKTPKKDKGSDETPDQSRKRLSKGDRLRKLGYETGQAGAAGRGG